MSYTASYSDIVPQNKIWVNSQKAVKKNLKIQRMV